MNQMPYCTYIYIDARQEHGLLVEVPHLWVDVRSQEDQDHMQALWISVAQPPDKDQENIFL